MSSSTKFLNVAQGDISNQSAAQDFLNEKLSKNRFTQEQQQRLDDNGGSKTFGTGYKTVVTNQDEIDAFNAKPKTNGGYADLDVDMDAKYKSGQWGSGKHSKQQLADKFGLDINAAENKGDTAVWGTNRSGDRVFLGNIDNSFRSNDDVIKAHSAQADSGEINHGDKPEEVSSDGDVIGAMLNMWDGGKETAKQKAPKPIEEKQKIEHSPEIRQAKERVRTYEDDILSGKTSEDIYKTGSNSDYTFDSTKGAAGIGTPMSGDSGQQASKATASFLDNKKSQVKDKYQFQVQG